MPQVLPPWPPTTPIEATIWAAVGTTFSALVSATALGLNAFTQFLGERRRSESIEIKVNRHYRIHDARDRYRFPDAMRHSSLRDRQRVCLIKITYRGRHSARLGNVSWEIDCTAIRSIEPPAAPHTLLDGQSRYVLVAETTIIPRSLTGFVVETETHGNQFKAVNYRRRLVMALLLVKPSRIIRTFWEMKYFMKDLLRSPAQRRQLAFEAQRLRSTSSMQLGGSKPDRTGSKPRNPSGFIDRDATPSHLSWFALLARSRAGRVRFHPRYSNSSAQLGSSAFRSEHTPRLRLPGRYSGGLGCGSLPRRSITWGSRATKRRS